MPEPICSASQGVRTVPVTSKRASRTRVRANTWTGTNTPMSRAETRVAPTDQRDQRPGTPWSHRNARAVKTGSITIV